VPDIPQQTYTNPLQAPTQEFLDQFTQFTANMPSFDDVNQHRFVAQTYDHALTDGPNANSRKFITSDQCSNCHGGFSPTGLDANMVIRPPFCTTDEDCRTAGCEAGATCNMTTMVCNSCDTKQIDVSPYAEWRVSPMGLAGRDPIVLAQLESEVNHYSPPAMAPCVESLCLHCHSMMGQWQLRIDAGTTPPPAACDSLFRNITPPQAIPNPVPPSFLTDQLFTRDYLDAWPDGVYAASHAKYGGLGRDGVSCAVCHHVADTDLGKSKTFTGNLVLGDSKSVIGPYSNNVETRPMQNALGITPQYGAQMKDSAVCGTCHAIFLPILDKNNALAGGGYEQTTYLEWVNSKFAGPQIFDSCQDCHMVTL
jgi:hypothetical protein